MFECQIISLLNKVYCDRIPDKHLPAKISALRGEKISFQIAMYSETGGDVSITVKKSPLSNKLRMRHVKMVPGLNLRTIANPENPHKNLYEQTKPGLFPDLLTDMAESFPLVPFFHQSIWCDVVIPGRFKAGNYDLEFQISLGEETKTVSIQLEVIAADLPEQTLKHTEWFYCDCIAMAHKEKPWSRSFWNVLKKYFLDFSEHGMNMILTPVFTPPLDTAVGGERMTTQLVRVRETPNGWRFDFRHLRTWIRLAQKCGIRYFEISHLFTQWGAAATPKVICISGKKEKRIFGWDVPANSTQWQTFLSDFLPALRGCLVHCGVYDNCYFHVSDEPNVKQLDGYRFASDLLRKYLPDAKFMDAMSDPDFFRKGYCRQPVAAIHHLKEFLNLPVPERMTYYCCEPQLPYPNRLLGMPSSANRILGVLLYIYEIKGFLHWGYNFWNFGLTGKFAPPATPYADPRYPAGDPCLVYPGNGGPLGSIREEVLFSALQDLRSLQLLEQLSSRAEVLDLIRKCSGGSLPETDKFPLKSDYLYEMREAVNSRIRELIGRA